MMQREEAGTSTVVGRGQLSRHSMESISERVSKLDNLYFPRKVQPYATTPSERKSLLLGLLSSDIAVFLERYGSQLSWDELKEFDVLKDDYEINWHLNHLRSVLSPTEEDLRSRSAKIKNRRLAYLDKLVSDGQYFSEDSMREREPYLHHEYLGKFQDPSGRRMARPGERWWETLMRWSEEAMLVERIRGEQQRLGVDQRDWVGNEREEQEEMEEEEEEEEEEDEKETEVGKKEEGETIINFVTNGTSHLLEEHADDISSGNDVQASTSKSTVGESLSVEEMQDRLDQFTHIMQQKFLSGEDHQHLDYSKIDENESLDDHWMKEATQDAEEKYFDDV